MVQELRLLENTLIDLGIYSRDALYQALKEEARALLDAFNADSVAESARLSSWFSILDARALAVSH